MRSALILLLGAAVVSALPTDGLNRIVGGSVTTIQQYPFSVALLASSTGTSHTQSCGGTIINNRSVLTAAFCFMKLPSAIQWRSRVGSTNSNSGGSVFNTNKIIKHPNFTSYNLHMDISVIRIVGTFSFNNFVQAGVIAGPNYQVPDNTPFWAIGWGYTCERCAASEQLRHVQLLSVNQDTCRQLYKQVFVTITDNMLCAGWLSVGGRDSCIGDSGSPLLHNNVVVGVTSLYQCASARFPGFYTRVSTASNWILSNA